MLKSADGVVAYRAEQSDGTYVVIFNANADKTATFTRTITVRKPAVQPASDKKSDAVQSPNTGSAITGFALAAVALAIASVFAFAASRRKED
jgi:pullulanase